MLQSTQRFVISHTRLLVTFSNTRSPPACGFRDVYTTWQAHCASYPESIWIPNHALQKFFSNQLIHRSLAFLWSCHSLYSSATSSTAIASRMDQPITQEQRIAFGLQWTRFAFRQGLDDWNVASFKYGILCGIEDHQIRRALSLQKQLGERTSIPVPIIGFTYNTPLGNFEVKIRDEPPRECQPHDTKEY